MEEDILNYLSTVMFRGTPCIFDELYVKLSLDTEIYRFKYSHTVKPLITNTSEEFIKCRLDNFSMSFILYFVNFSIYENK